VSPPRITDNPKTTTDHLSGVPRNPCVTARSRETTPGPIENTSMVVRWIETATKEMFATTVKLNERRGAPFVCLLHSSSLLEQTIADETWVCNRLRSIVLRDSHAKVSNCDRLQSSERTESLSPLFSGARLALSRLRPLRLRLHRVRHRVHMGHSARCVDSLYGTPANQ
jgi:hypothetical protein